MKAFSKKIIYGCESRGDGGSPYLTRVTLFECALFAIYLHNFHRSDNDDMHDHPWHFVSMLLWRGYIEHTTAGARRYYPGSILFRRATHRHRVELVRGKSARSLVFRTAHVRDWGFYPVNGGPWIQWVEYFKRMGC